MTADGETAIKILESANLNDMLHESMHSLQRIFSEDQQKDIAIWKGYSSYEEYVIARSKYFVGELSREESKLFREREEKLAKAYEYYLADGKSPNPKMAKVFETISHFLYGIYKNIKRAFGEYGPDRFNIDAVVKSQDCKEIRIRDIFDSLYKDDYDADSELFGDTNPIKAKPSEDLQKMRNNINPALYQVYQNDFNKGYYVPFGSVLDMRHGIPLINMQDYYGFFNRVDTYLNRTSTEAGVNPNNPEELRVFKSYITKILSKSRDERALAKKVSKNKLKENQLENSLKEKDRQKSIPNRSIDYGLLDAVTEDQRKRYNAYLNKRLKSFENKKRIDYILDYASYLLPQGPDIGARLPQTGTFMHADKFKHGKHDIVAVVYHNGKKVAYLPFDLKIDTIGKDKEGKWQDILTVGRNKDYYPVLGLDINSPGKYVILKDDKVLSVRPGKPFDVKESNKALPFIRPENPEDIFKLNVILTRKAAFTDDIQGFDPNAGKSIISQIKAYRKNQEDNAEAVLNKDGLTLSRKRRTDRFGNTYEPVTVEDFNNINNAILHNCEWMERALKNPNKTTEHYDIDWVKKELQLPDDSHIEFVSKKNEAQKLVDQMLNKATLTVKKKIPTTAKNPEDAILGGDFPLDPNKKYDFDATNQLVIETTIVNLPTAPETIHLTDVTEKNTAKFLKTHKIVPAIGSENYQVPHGPNYIPPKEQKPVIQPVTLSESEYIPPEPEYIPQMQETISPEPIEPPSKQEMQSPQSPQNAGKIIIVGANDERYEFPVKQGVSKRVAGNIAEARMFAMLGKRYGNHIVNNFIKSSKDGYKAFTTPDPALSKINLFRESDPFSAYKITGISIIDPYLYSAQKVNKNGRLGHIESRRLPIIAMDAIDRVAILQDKQTHEYKRVNIDANEKYRTNLAYDVIAVLDSSDEEAVDTAYDEIVAGIYNPNIFADNKFQTDPKYSPEGDLISEDELDNDGYSKPLVEENTVEEPAENDMSNHPVDRLPMKELVAKVLANDAAKQAADISAQNIEPVTDNIEEVTESIQPENQSSEPEPDTYILFGDNDIPIQEVQPKIETDPYADDDTGMDDNYAGHILDAPIIDNRIEPPSEQSKMAKESRKELFLQNLEKLVNRQILPAKTLASDFEFLLQEKKGYDDNGNIIPDILDKQIDYLNSIYSPTDWLSLKNFYEDKNHVLYEKINSLFDNPEKNKYYDRQEFYKQYTAIYGKDIAKVQMKIMDGLIDKWKLDHPGQDPYKEALRLLRIELGKATAIDTDPFMNQVEQADVNTDNFRNWFDGAHEYFGDSNNPKRLYHGSKNKFEEFDMSKLGSNTGAESAKLGIFFATNKEVAKSYLGPEREAHIINSAYRFNFISKSNNFDSDYHSIISEINSLIKSVRESSRTEYPDYARVFSKIYI
jgi:hypothetical protein